MQVALAVAPEAERAQDVVHLGQGLGGGLGVGMWQILSKDNQSHSVASVALSRTQRPSELIRAHQSSSELIKAHQRPSEAISGHQSSSEAIRVHQSSSDLEQRLAQLSVDGVHVERD